MRSALYASHVGSSRSVRLVLTCHRPSPNLGDLMTFDLASPLLQNGHESFRTYGSNPLLTCLQTGSSVPGPSIRSVVSCSLSHRPPRWTLVAQHPPGISQRWELMPWSPRSKQTRTLRVDGLNFSTGKGVNEQDQRYVVAEGE